MHQKSHANLRCIPWNTHVRMSHLHSEIKSPDFYTTAAVPKDISSTEKGWEKESCYTFYKDQLSFKENIFRLLQIFQPSRSFTRKIVLLTVGVLSTLVLAALLMPGVLEGSDSKDAIKLPHHSRSDIIFASISPRMVTSSNLSALLQFPRISTHCNLPDRPIVGMEGFVDPEYKLKIVHIITTPGEITPTYTLGETHRDIDTLSSLESICSFSDRHNRFKDIYHLHPLIQRVLHMNSHFQNHSLLQHNRNCQQRQLSPMGAAQTHKLGQYLYQTYRKHWESSLRIPKNLFEIKSIDSAESFQSAVSILSGIHGDDIHDDSNLHIQNVPASHCSHYRERCDCRKVEATKHYYYTAIRGSQSGISQTSSDIPSKDVLHQILPPLCNQQNPISCHGNVCRNLTGENVQRLFSDVDNTLKNLTSQKDFTEFTELLTYQFMMHIIRSFKPSIDQDNKVSKMFVHSVEDSFLTFLLLSLQYKESTTFSHPASRLIFELYEKDQSQENTNKKSQGHREAFKKHRNISKTALFIRILYNGVDITKNVPLCHKHHKVSLCPLKYIVDFHKINYLKKFPKGNHSAACQL